MMSLLAGLLLFQAASGQPLRQSVIRPDKVESALLGGPVDVNVYLPAGFDAASDTKYPVVYLLHGLYGTYKDWETAGHMKDVVDELIASGEIVPMVIIMPNAGDPDIHNNWNGYFNMPGHPYEDFFFQELIPTVEARYKVYGDKQHRAVMGLSMGGGGSTVYAQRHPDLFSSCYAMSAWLDSSVREDMEKDKFYLVNKAVREHSAREMVLRLWRRRRPHGPVRRPLPEDARPPRPQRTPHPRRLARLGILAHRPPPLPPLRLAELRQVI